MTRVGSPGSTKGAKGSPNASNNASENRRKSAPLSRTASKGAPGVPRVPSRPQNTPIFVKLSPDETEENLKNLIEVSEKNSIDGFICCNTTTDHNYPIAGGMSGAMLSKKAVNMQKKVAEFKQEKSILISSGGVMNASDIEERLINSADLVQLYTGFVYEGPRVVKRINKALIRE